MSLKPRPHVAARADAALPHPDRALGTIQRLRQLQLGPATQFSEPGQPLAKRPGFQPIVIAEKFNNCRNMFRTRRMLSLFPATDDTGGDAKDFRHLDLGQSQFTSTVIEARGQAFCGYLCRQGSGRNKGHRAIEEKGYATHNLDGGGESNRANQIGVAFLYLANKVKFAASAPISLILAFVEFPSDIRDAQDDL
jgi:hypothetical protein